MSGPAVINAVEPLNSVAPIQMQMYWSLLLAFSTFPLPYLQSALILKYLYHPSVIHDFRWRSSFSHVQFTAERGFGSCRTSAGLAHWLCTIITYPTIHGPLYFDSISFSMLSKTQCSVAANSQRAQGANMRRKIVCPLQSTRSCSAVQTLD